MTAATHGLAEIAFGGRSSGKGLTVGTSSAGAVGRPDRFDLNT